LQTVEQRQCDIAIEVAFMKLVEDDAAYSPKFRIGDDPAREDAFGEEAKPCRWSAYFVEAHLVTDGLAERFTEFLGYPAGRHAGGDAARFEDQYFSELEKGGRDTSGLPGAGRRLDHDGARPAQTGRDLGEDGVDRKLNQKPMVAIRYSVRLGTGPGLPEGVTCRQSDVQAWVSE
jgi:hypothetical protein